jgi:hypothetical protein
MNPQKKRYKSRWVVVTLANFYGEMLRWSWKSIDDKADHNTGPIEDLKSDQKYETD